MPIKNGYIKKKGYLICIDSDGCVMDTMNIKHIQCFGPKVVEEWNLEDYANIVLEMWMDQNLYSKTRGINRFQGLSLLFETLAKQGIRIPEYEQLTMWCKETTSLSKAALKEVIHHNPSVCLKKALSWSNKVNEAIEALPKVDSVFPNAKAAMHMLHEKADLVIVSSANKEAVQEEWTRLGCMEYVSMLCGQEAGTKEYCIAELKSFYPKGNVLMIGDALSDLKAAQVNEVAFYPILAKDEALSWLRLKEEVGAKFLNGEFAKADMNRLEDEMKARLT